MKTFGCSVIDVGDELTVESARGLNAQLATLLADGNVDHILDLSGLTHLDSSGLASLITALRKVRDVGGSVSLIAGSEHVNHILQLTAFNRLFPVFQTREAAIGRLETAA